MQRSEIQDKEAGNNPGFRFTPSGLLTDSAVNKKAGLAGFFIYGSKP
jgi:hypothetical protein